MKLALLFSLAGLFFAIVTLVTRWSVRWAQRRGGKGWLWGGLTLLFSTPVVLVAVLFLGVKLVPLMGVEARDGERPVRNATEHNGRVQFRLRNTHFEVPRQYFKGVAVSGGGVVEHALLWALLPNFEGYAKAVNHHDFFEVHHKGRRIQIMLLPRGRRMTVAQIVDKSLSNSVDVLGKHQGRYDEMRYGLEYYRTEYGAVASSEYLYRQNGVPVILFRCHEDFQVPYPGCQGRWDYNDEVAVNFDFGIKYLPRWRSIMTHIQQLLDGKLDVKPVRQSEINETQGE
jgi:hypothetical protein